jgi:branched-chain amino acid transport system permease protein
LLARVAKFGFLGRIWKPLLALSLAVMVGLAGFVMGVEMLYHLTLDSANGSSMTLLKQEIDTRAARPWLVAASLMLGGALGYRKLQPDYYEAWSGVNAQITARQRGGRA